MENATRIFKLRRYDQLKYADIAGQSGISKKIVETQMSRVLVMLKHKLSHYLLCGIILLVSLWELAGF